MWARPVATLAAAVTALLGPALTAAPAAAAPAAGTSTLAAAPAAGASAVTASATPTIGTQGAATPDGGAGARTAPSPEPTGSAADAPDRATRNAAAEGLDVEITDIGPAVLRPGQRLTVRGTVANTTGKDVASPEALLRVQRSTPISRSTLQRWLEPDSVFATVVVARHELPAALPAGSSATFMFDVAPEELSLGEGASAWGPRGIEVAVDDASGTADEDGRDRSFMLWYPDIAIEPTPVGVLAPVVPTAAERTRALTDGTDVATAAAQRLVPLLGALDQPGVTVAVDGMLLTPGAGAMPDADGGPGVAPATSAPTAAASPTAPDSPPPPEPPAAARSGPAASPAAADLLGAITALTQDGREVVALPWADADVTALAHAGREDLLVAAQERSAAAATAAGLEVRSDIAWPAGSLPDQETADLAAATGAAAVVLPSTSLTPEQALTYTPAGRADLPVDEGGEALPAVLVDERASAVLAGQLLPRLNAADGDITDLDALAVRQLLLADTAVIARERPNDPRPLMISLPRSFHGSPESVSGALAALATAPWVTPSAVSDLAGADAPTLARSPLPEKEVGRGEVGAGLLNRMAGTLARAESFGAITADSDALLAPYAAVLASALSVSWRADPDGREALVDDVRSAVGDLDSKVAALPSSTVNLINSSARIPINVRNDLDVDVDVQVMLTPTDQRLQAPEPVPLTVPADSQATAHVPVRAVGSGDLPVEVQLLTPQGRDVGTPTELQVRVRADWENVGTAVVAGVLVVMLVAGIVRTARRGPRMEQGTMPDPEE
ncbi:DUF6049 family protein [Georgenia sp. SYP-B2076]|uniref:DUF6049 family protein n=1 Tax=Georgenia sp. SYP-B2076 TaxID=2495881 RepID=UPI000F8C671B|nr:DUF6049 family protein [Georgenia sp. SYP-B2076]